MKIMLLNWQVLVSKSNLVKWIPVEEMSYPHCHGISFGVLACPWHATMSGCLYGPHMTSIWSWWNPSRTSLWVRGPIDPKEVPWDQNFSLKFFLISSSKDVILCDLGICFAKNSQKWEKQPNFALFLCKEEKWWKWPVFSNLEGFLQTKSPNHIK